MQTILPSFVLPFRCLADACKHSCCVGWEIDIDRQTLADYRTRKDSLSEEILLSVCEDDSGAHFCLTDEGRCPFLNENNLCRIIMADGADALPEICREHPRFRNYCGDEIVELGLGLSCEAAVALALSQQSLAFFSMEGEVDSLWDLSAVEKKPLSFDFAKLDGYYKDFMCEKYGTLSRLTSPEIPTDQRIRELVREYHIDDSDDFFSAFFERLRSLEIMEDAWGALLDAAHGIEIASLEANAQSLMLLALFIYRHASAEGFYSLECAISLAYHLTHLAQHLCKSAKGIMSFFDVVRLLSSELEYNEENTESLLDFCEERRGELG